MKVLFYQMLPDIQKCIDFWMVTGFSHLSYWYGQLVD